MSILPNSVSVAFELLAERRFAEFGKRCAGLIRDAQTVYGLRRDLEVPLIAPKAKIPISVRQFQESDRSSLFSDDLSGLDRKERVEIRTRRAHYEAAIPTCYVAVDDSNGAPCYFQWLMGPNENLKIQAYFPQSWFPVLQADEALLENAYTPPAYRGKGIMSAAMAIIAERAALIGCRYVITFVEKDNVPSLRGCKNAGFAPYIARLETRLLFNTFKHRRFGAIIAEPASTSRRH